MRFKTTFVHQMIMMFLTYLWVATAVELFEVIMFTGKVATAVEVFEVIFTGNSAGDSMAFRCRRGGTGKKVQLDTR